MFESTSSSIASPASFGRRAGWGMVLRGVIAVVFGVIALRSPNIAAHALLVVFAIYAFADGLLGFALAAQLGRAGQPWGWHLFEGILDVGLGIVALAYPGATLWAVVVLIGIRALALGVLEIVGAATWEQFPSRWLLGITGGLSIILGVLLVANPAAGGLALLWTIGVYAIVFGAMLFALGLRLLTLDQRGTGFHRPAATAG